jgi:nickel transport protein
MAPAVPFSSLAAGLVLAAGFLVPGRPVGAHAIESSLERVSGLTDALVLETRFGPGQPAADAEVRLVAPGGSAISLGRTDAHGTLRFQLPRNAGPDWEVVVDQGPGHRDYLELPPPAATRQGAGPAATLVRPRPRIHWPATLGSTPLAVAGVVALGGLGCTAFRRRRR